MDIRKLLKSLVAYKASDLHLRVNTEPNIRIDGRLVSLNLPVLTNIILEELAYSLITNAQKERLLKKKILLFSIVLPDVGRFRATYAFVSDSLVCSFRIIPIEIPSLEQLALPPLFNKLTQQSTGLILLAGVIGSGKTTTLAAMLQEINSSENRHIVTIEDPVEFMYFPEKSLITQIDLGKDEIDLGSAVELAKNLDADVIYFGELDTAEKVFHALQMASSGYLVFATFNSISVEDTLEYMLLISDEKDHPLICKLLSHNLLAVIVQILLPRIGGGRVPVHEIMHTNPVLSNIIKHANFSQIRPLLNQGNEELQSQNLHLLQYIQDKIISKEDALRYSNDPEELLKLL